MRIAALVRDAEAKCSRSRGAISRVSSRAAIHALSLLLLSGIQFAGAADKFPKPCDLPYNGQGSKQNIDKKCPPEGKVSENQSAEKIARQEAQNRAKNNLCAAGTARPASFELFDQLQAAVDAAGIAYGSSANLPGRQSLTNLTTASGTFSEGDVVVLEGWLEHAKRAGKESCNCGLSTVKDTDIHIHLARDPGVNRCESVVAEMTPHYRPTEWTAARLQNMSGWYVRVAGPLFFDASHKPCSGGQSIAGQPARRSNWEIHPVYKFEVCVYEECDDPSAWYTVKQWKDEYE